MAESGKVGCFGKAGNHLMAAMHDGAEAIGLSPCYVYPLLWSEDEAKEYGLVIVIGMLEQSRRIRDHYAGQGIPVLVLDAAFIFRDRGYYQVSLGNLNGIPDDAPHDRAAAMGLVVEDRVQSRGHHVLVVGQKPRDAQHSLDTEAWCKATCSVLESITDRPVIYRPHPQSQNEPTPKHTLVSNLTNCHCMVTHNSTAAYEAILHGVPVICDSCAAYADVCETDIGQVEHPRQGSTEERQKLLDRVAAGQFTLDEMRSGEALLSRTPIILSSATAN